MKKQKSKAGGKASTSKKKEEKPDVKDAEAPTADDEHVEDPPDQNTVPQDDKFPEAIKEGSDMAEKKTSPSGSHTSDKPSHNRQPSLSLQSKMRSASFRRTSTSQGPLSPVANGAKSPEVSSVSPEGDYVNSIYRKQAARLDELERENKKLAQDAQDAERKLKRTEEELDELREASGEVAELKSKAQKLEAQTEELNKLVFIACCTSALTFVDPGTEAREQLFTTPNFSSTDSEL